MFVIPCQSHSPFEERFRGGDFNLKCDCLNYANYNEIIAKHMFLY